MTVTIIMIIIMTNVIFKGWPYSSKSRFVFSPDQRNVMLLSKKTPSYLQENQ